MAKKIVILEDNQDRQRAMRLWLADRFYQFEARFFSAVGDLLDYLDKNLEDTIAISLDHDLELVPGPEETLVDPGNGREVVRFLTQKQPVCPVIIHSSNVNAAIGMEMELREAKWETIRVCPYDDLEWIPEQWFPSLRRAIVGPIEKYAAQGISKK